MPHDEEQPLLRPTRPSNPRASSSRIHQTHNPNKIVFLLVVIVFILEIGSYMLVVPTTRILEDIICHHYYEDVTGAGHINLTEDIDEKLCKVDKIQSELAFVRGVNTALYALPGVLLSMPYGLLGDKIGRKPVLILSLVGLILSTCWMLLVCWFWTVFPLRLIWLAAIFQAIGGGNVVAVTMILTIVSDVVTKEDRATAFLRASVGGMLAELLAPTISSKMMSHSLWLPTFVGLGVLIAGSFILFVIPETLHLRPAPVSDPTSVSAPAEDESRRPTKPEDTTILKSIVYECKLALYHLRESSALIASPPLILLLITFFTRPISTQSTEFIPQYISRRFDWALQSTGYIISLCAAINILLVLAILPAISHWLTSHRNYAPAVRDLLLARISALVLVIGALFIAGPTAGISIFGTIIYTLGTGFSALTRSLLTTLVDSQHVARLYSAAGVLDMIGAMVAGPGIPLLWKLGLKWKGNWLGLPFFGAMVLCSMSAACVWIFRLPKEAMAEEEGEEGRDEGI